MHRGLKMRALLLVGIVLLWMAAPGLAGAESSNNDEARALYRTGSTLFKRGELRRAADAFRRGYQLSGRPEFLVNLAQCHRALGEPEQAITFLERFIRDAPHHAMRPSAEHTLAELRRAVARQPRRDLAPASKPVTLDLAVAPAAPPRRPSAHGGSSWWKWALIVAAGLVAAGGIAVGVYYGTRDSPPPVVDTIVLPAP